MQQSHLNAAVNTRGCEVSEGAQPFRAERLRRLAEMVRTNGRITVTDAASTLGTSTETIRKDLIALESRGIVRRVHGGALHVEPMTHEPLVDARVANREEKRRIALTAVTEVPNTGAIFVDAGSTTGMLAELFPNRRLTVFTNALSIATRLATLPALTIHTLGGRVRPVTLAEVGPTAMEVISHLHFDLAFVGTNSISCERGLSTPDPDEAAIKAAMIRNSERSVLLADHSKFAHTSLVRYAGVDELDAIVTDSELGERHRAALAELDVEVFYA